jgi:GAF domain-containing protein/biotin carboxyl carrier protein
MARDTEIPRMGERAEAALAGLLSCDNLAQTSAWAAQLCAAPTGAEAAAVWAPDPIHPIYFCSGIHGSGARQFLRRTAERGGGIVLRLLRGREAIALHRQELAGSKDAFLAGAPDWAQAALALPLEAETGLFFLLCLFYREPAGMAAAREGLGAPARTAATALARALRAERKSAGMLHAIERLTNLYDLSKAFGSTLDADELSGIVVRKAADLTGGEAASLWLLDAGSAEVALSGTAVNENYDVEAPPESIGGAVVGDVIAEKTLLRRNEIPDGDPSATEETGYRVRSLLAAPLVDEDDVEGAIVVANKRGRHQEFSEEDQDLLQDLARQAIRALRNARRYEAEKKVEELDALLAVSREITSTLDLDRVMRTVVNGTAALVAYDRCSIAIQDRAKLRLGAVSGTAEINRKDPTLQRSEELLQWVYLGGQDVAVRQGDDGALVADRPETEEKFRSFFAESGNRSFFGMILRDEEGKLGVLAFESKDPLVFDTETRDLLQILVNQATVALRNAQLYQQVALVGFMQPLLDRWRRFHAIPQSRRAAWAIGAALLLVFLVFVPWRLRIVGPARVLPGRRGVVTAGVDGIVASVRHREGDRVTAGEVVATLQDEAYQAALADARASFAIADSDLARFRAEGNAAASFEAQSRRDELRSRVAMEEQRVAWTKLTAPMAGVLVTPRIEERVGQNVTRGGEFCIVADTGTVTVEVAMPEEDSSMIRTGASADVKLNPYPTRTFHGEVSRVGAAIREEGKDRFVIAEVTVANPEGDLKTGMLGKVKVRAGSRRILTLILRKPARALYSKIWPLLP